MANMISGLAGSEAMRTAIQKIQLQLAKGQKELASGTVADEGLALGSKVGQAFSLRNQQSQLTAILETNKLASTRMQALQTSMTSIMSSAKDFSTQLMASRSSTENASNIATDAKTLLASFEGILNTSVSGEYIFAGENSSEKPVASYFSTPASAAQQAIDASFQAKFGFPPGDPQAKNISQADMQSFLDNEFQSAFDAANWSATTSSASDTPIKSRISPNESVDTSVTANEPAMRKLAMAYTMVAGLGVDQMNSGAYQATMEKAISMIGEAVSDLTSAQAKVGYAQQRVSAANDRMTLQSNMLESSLGDLVGVDYNEVTMRIQSLTTQMEMAYTVTGRIQQLSLLNFL